MTETLVTTGYGQIEGIAEEGIKLFLGVPFAKPPVGDLSFRHPLPPEPWDGVLSAVRARPNSIQGHGHKEYRVTDRDCLYLNVFAPDTQEDKLPVMVWIFGGSYCTGGRGLTDVVSDDLLYDMRRFARDTKTIVVTFNYRLNLEGFLNLSYLDPTFEMNNGLYDQIAALKFVRENIGAFGGDDRNITVLTRVADAYRKIRDFKKSKQLYLKVLEMEDTNAYAVIGLGHLHYDFKEYRDALYYWTKMLDLNPNNVDIRVLTSIGNCHRKLKTFDQGLIYFQKALDIDPKNFYALFGMADCYRGMNQQFRSVEYWNKILEMDPNNKVILTRAGDAYRNTGDYKLAAEYYNRAMDIDFDIYAALGLALICKGEGKYDEAIDRLSALIRDDPKNYRLNMELADCYIKKNQRNKAVEVLQAYQRQGRRSQAVNDMLDRLENNRPLF